MPTTAPIAPPAPPAPPPAMPVGGETRILIPSLSWDGYENFLAEIGDGHLRISYLEGMAELMSPGPIHEQFGYILGRMVSDLIVELNIPAKGQRSTTFRRPELGRGVEPDECFYLESLASLRGRNIATDPLPPPDLVIEVEVTSPLVNKLAIYAGLGVPEVWRHDRCGLTILLLGPDGQYTASGRSRAFPFLPMDGFRAQLAAYDPEAETAWTRAYRAWVRETVAPLVQP